MDAVEGDADLHGQRLMDLLTEPCQRAIRYSTECGELLRAAALGGPDSEIGSSGVTRGQARENPSEELAERLDAWVGSGCAGLRDGEEYVGDLPDVMRAFVALQKEARRLNNVRHEREARRGAPQTPQRVSPGRTHIHGGHENLQSPRTTQ